jgi:asparaginyl-tRNA synthetase
MKTVYVSDLLSYKEKQEIELYGWILNRNDLGSIIFLNITDSTGSINSVVEKNNVTEEVFKLSRHTPLESGIELKGIIQKNGGKVNEIKVTELTVIGKNTLCLTPQPRSDFDILDISYSGLLSNHRHVYLRNPKLMGILRFRSDLMRIIRQWFYENRFVEFDAPILTPAPLYDDQTAIPVNVHGDNIFLSQCAGFYLEAGVHAFERVFNMGPSFRGEESRSKRHLIEYWHIKAEIAFGDREDIMHLVEEIIGYVTQQCQIQCGRDLESLGFDLCTDGLKSPYPRISYENAIKKLRSQGVEIGFGQSISTSDEKLLSEGLDKPFWIVGIPRNVEPFPYVIDPNANDITMVADLIASNGCGELLGVAEKIHDPAMLDERLKEKGKLGDPRYQFIREIHQAGCVPHIAFGMGLERLIRWLLNISHVRDTTPFPRTVKRKISP